MTSPRSDAAQRLRDIDSDIFRNGSPEEKRRWDGAKEDARAQLAREGARIPESSPEYLATQRFMALSKTAPKQAETVFASTFMPTATAPDMKVKGSGQYSANRSLDDIVSKRDSADYQARANGVKPIAQQQLPGNDGQAQNPHTGGNSKPAVPSAGGGDGRIGPTPRYQLSAPSRAKQIERDDTGTIFGSNKPFMGLENDPDAFRRRILNDKLELGKTGHLAGTAFDNEVKAVNENVVQPAKKTLTPLVDQSLNEGKRILHNLFDDKPTTKAPIATDDLPPVKPIPPTKKLD